LDHVRRAGQHLELDLVAIRALYRLRYELALVGHCWPPCRQPSDHIETHVDVTLEVFAEIKTPAEAGMDMPTLAALLGHSELNKVMRYAHPQEQQKADAMKRLEVFNAAKEIAEIEKAKTVPYDFPHSRRKSRKFSSGKI
jgi:hypothetical protein